jgi:NTE family protein
LVLEGGGDRGAYQAGAVRGLVENLPPKDVEYDVVSGVSIGAINAAGFSFFKPGKEDEASQYLSKHHC